MVQRIKASVPAVATPVRPAAQTTSSAAPAKNVVGAGWRPPASLARPAALEATRFEGGTVDGKAFCQAALSDIRARTARGEKVRVVFDIDNTLADTRARTLAIGRAFDRANKTSHFKGVGLGRIGYDGAQTAKNLGMDGPATAAFKKQWDVDFWKGENFAHDLPMKDIVKLARAAKAAGAEVTYLTGRVDEYRGATLTQLQRFKLPDADSTHLFCKPDLSVRTAPYKAEQLAKWTADGSRIGWFFTEGRRDTAHIQTAQPGVPCVLLDSSQGGPEAVRSDTPLYPRVF